MWGVGCGVSGVIVADLNGKAIGFGTYGPFRARPAYSKSIEHSVYVHKDHRGKAVGNSLMVELIKLAKVGEFHTMIAGIDSSNMNSVEFHRKFGFEVVGTFKEVGLEGICGEGQCRMTPPRFSQIYRK